MMLSGSALPGAGGRQPRWLVCSDADEEGPRSTCYRWAVIVITGELWLWSQVSFHYHHRCAVSNHRCAVIVITGELSVITVISNHCHHRWPVIISHRWAFIVILSSARDWKLTFISCGHVLCDWQWCKIDATDRTFCLADENSGRRWRIYECSCCTCCVCYDRLISQDTGYYVT